MLQFNFKTALFTAVVNTAADFFSRQELKVTEKIRLKIREGIHTASIEVTISSSDVADEDQVVSTQTDNENETEEQNPERKTQIAEECDRMGSERGTILNGAKYQAIYKDRWKQYVILHQRNQGKCTHMGGARR